MNFLNFRSPALNIWMLFLALPSLFHLTQVVDITPLATAIRWYIKSVDECSAGQRMTLQGLIGVLVGFADTDSRSNFWADLLHPDRGDEIESTYSSFAGMAASITSETLFELLNLEELPSGLQFLEADCMQMLNDPADTDPKTKPPGTLGRRRTQGGSYSALSWGLDRIDTSSGLDGTYVYGAATGSGSRIYILDTGVRTSHSDFGGRAIAGWSAGCRTGSESACGGIWHPGGAIPPEATTCNGHGTHCASTAAGSDYGVAKGAIIISVQVLSCSGTGSGSGIIAGIEWAVADALANPTAPSVISMSLGGGKSNSVNTAVSAAVAAGVSVVAAAGNENQDACNRSPGSAAAAITVGSTASDDSKSGFSNWGRCVDVFAPGSGITAAWVTSDTSTAYLSGTSMACPHVAGAVALLRTSRPSLAMDEVDSVIKCMATPNVITGLDAASPNLFLLAGAAMADSQLTSCAGSVLASPPPLSPSPPPGWCTNACTWSTDGR